MRRTVLNRIGLGLSALFLVTALGLTGCATQEQLNAAVKKAEDAAARAEAAAQQAEKAAHQCEKAAAKCQKTFEKGLQK
jgi:preprotein translocase subunit SecG